MSEWGRRGTVALIFQGALHDFFQISSAAIPELVLVVNAVEKRRRIEAVLLGMAVGETVPGPVAAGTGDLLRGGEPCRIEKKLPAQFPFGQRQGIAARYRLRRIGQPERDPEFEGLIVQRTARMLEV